MLMQEDLNDQQRIAVDHVDGPLLVLAGAGSGKTRIVTHRIVTLLEKGIPAHQILAVTFTNKAADEMRERVQKLTDQRVLVSTFHSLGARLLRTIIDRIGFRTDFSIYDEDDSLRVLKAIATDLDLDTKKATLKTFKGMISEAKNALKGPDDASAPGRSQLAEYFPQVYRAYATHLKQYNAVDFDDLLYLPVQVFMQDRELLSRYQERWRYLLIDEYQDTNEAQYRLVKLLAGETKNVFVVGDPDQSIYSWRGANINNILGFEQDFPGARIVRLEQNYRSTGHILNAANAVVEHNEARYDKELWSALGDGEKIKVYRAENEYDEAHFVVSRICKHHEDDGEPLNQMVIFYRTNFQSRQFEDTLLSRRIPYVIVGGVSFYQRREIKDVLAFLRVVQSGADFVSFARTVNLPKRGIGNSSIDKLRAAAELSGMAIFDFCERAIQDASFAKEHKVAPRLKKGLGDYVSVINGIREKEKLEDQVRAAIEDSGYLGYLHEDESTFQDRKENVYELLAKAVQWSDEAEEEPLASFLEELSLKSTLDEASDQQDRLKLMTLHNGKGLEFDIVFLPGLEEDLLPHANSRGSDDALEEERRLCYVGMTRARRLLYISSAEERSIWGSLRTMHPSRFLYEIPPEHKESVGGYDIPDVVDEDFSPSREPHYVFDEGQAVFHPSYGVGTIIRAYEGGMGLTYEVFFQKDELSRTLVASKTRLSAI